MTEWMKECCMLNLNKWNDKWIFKRTGDRTTKINQRQSWTVLRRPETFARSGSSVQPWNLCTFWMLRKKSSWMEELDRQSTIAAKFSSTSALPSKTHLTLSMAHDFTATRRGLKRQHKWVGTGTEKDLERTELTCVWMKCVGRWTINVEKLFN